MDNQISINLFKQLNKENIKYAVLRNYKTLPESLGGSDIDLWVCCKDVKDFFSNNRECCKRAECTYGFLFTRYALSKSMLYE